MYLPDFTNRRFISASVLMTWLKEALYQHAYFAGGGGPFGKAQDSHNGAGGDIWEGYILYTGVTDTFRYHVYTGTSDITIYVNEVAVVTLTGAGGDDRAGTVTLSGLVAGRVYPVRVRASTGTADVYWLGLSHTPAYTAMATFADGNAVTGAQLEAIRGNLLSAQAVTDMPVAPTPEAERQEEFDDDNTGFNVWRGTFRRRCNRLYIKFRAWADDAKGTVDLRINGTSVYAQVASGAGEAEYTYSYDLTGLAFGEEYDARITMSRTGTSADDIKMWVRVEQVREYNTGKLPAATTPKAHGDTLTAAWLTNLVTIINDYHPGQSVFTGGCFPAYFEQPAIYSAPSKRYHLLHQKGYLRYQKADTGTPEIEPYAGDEVSLPTDETFYALANAGLIYGVWYAVDDCKFVQEYASA